MELWSDRYQEELPAALYLHIPFCVRKCFYCDFASFATREHSPKMQAYANRLQAQLDKLKKLGLTTSFETAYLGGGTPSLLDDEDLYSLVSCISELAPWQEFSMEANPESFSHTKAELLQKTSLSRISFGVQSLQEDEAKALGRWHTKEQSLAALKLAQAANFRVSADLMCAIEKQTDESFAASLRGLIDLGLGHISCYPLQIEEGTALFKRAEKEGAAYNDPDIQAARMQIAARLLQEAGYSRYEVASYAKPNQSCAHNIAYWTGKNYLGLGISAASMLSRAAYQRLKPHFGWPEIAATTARVRLKINMSVAAYTQAEKLSDLKFEIEELTFSEALAEDAMLSARMQKPFEKSLVFELKESFGPKAEACFSHLIEQAYLDEELAPTEKGWLQGNELYGELWDLC